VVSNIAVADRFGTSNPALTKVSSAHDFHLELGTNATSKFGHKSLACLDFRVAIEPRDGLALLVHVYLPFRERSIRDFSLLCLWADAVPELDALFILTQSYSISHVIRLQLVSSPD